MRVLIADADQTFLEILQSYLWDRGHEAEIASDGLECMAILRDFAPEVLVLQRDLLWGGSDGVLAQMQDDAAHSGTSVIMIADEDPREEFDDLARRPLAGWLKKPFRLVDLLRLIQSNSCTTQSGDVLDYQSRPCSS